MVYTKGIEDWCWSGIEPTINLTLKRETIIVVVHPDCRLYLGVAKNGIVRGKAKVANGKIVWVTCDDMVPKFKERFFDPLH